MNVPLSKVPDESDALSDLFAPDGSLAGREHAFDLLFFGWTASWLSAFWLMLVMATAIAALGLSENSAATVIGAMVVAPLGQPIIALGASIAIGLLQQTMRLLLLISIGAATVIVFAYVIGLVLPQATPDEQVLARTTPDLRDFGIALFAGIAGAYGYYRKEFSSVLAGVAIVVALVPPLCVTGLMMEEGRLLLARGAFLLFITNFVGIFFAAILVSFALGALKFGSLRNRRIELSLVISLVACVSVLVPLGLNYDRIVNPALQSEKYYALTRQVLNENVQRVVLQSLKVDGALANIVVKARSGQVGHMDALKAKLQSALDLQIDLTFGNATPGIS